jgi:hypothetical protein
VTVRLSRSPAAFHKAALLAIAVTLVPLPLLAADRTPAPTAQPLKASIARHAAHDALVSPAKPAKVKTTEARAQQPASSTAQSGGFFRSPTGIACLAVIAAGTGYAIYSTHHDRIHSVVRQNQ